MSLELLRLNDGGCPVRDAALARVDALFAACQLARTSGSEDELARLEAELYGDGFQSAGVFGEVASHPEWVLPVTQPVREAVGVLLTGVGGRWSHGDVPLERRLPGYERAAGPVDIEAYLGRLRAGDDRMAEWVALWRVTGYEVWAGEVMDAYRRLSRFLGDALRAGDRVSLV